MRCVYDPWVDVETGYDIEPVTRQSGILDECGSEASYSYHYCRMRFLESEEIL